jgi:dolichol-phosphate mannosyltransferase
VKKKLLIFTATYNEKNNIKIFLNNFIKLSLNADLLIIDDNSPDKTSEVIKQYQKKTKILNLLLEKKKRASTPLIN